MNTLWGQKSGKMSINEQYMERGNKPCLRTRNPLKPQEYNGGELGMDRKKHLLYFFFLGQSLILTALNVLHVSSPHPCLE